MGRVFFPTYSLNRFGVRDTDQRATLGALGDPGPARFPAEPTPRAAMTPTPSILGAVANGAQSQIVYGGAFTDGGPIPAPPYWGGVPIRMYPPPVPPTPSGPAPAAAPPTAPPPVSTQVGPTPTVTVPPPAPSAPLLISSGGGTQSVSTPTVVASAPVSLVDNLAGWLGRSTKLFNYNVPNALLAGVVILGFAWLSSSSGKKR